MLACTSTIRSLLLTLSTFILSEVDMFWLAPADNNLHYTDTRASGVLPQVVLMPGSPFWVAHLPRHKGPPYAIHEQWQKADGPRNALCQPLRYHRCSHLHPVVHVRLPKAKDWHQRCPCTLHGPHHYASQCAPEAIQTIQPDSHHAEEPCMSLTQQGMQYVRSDGVISSNC